MDDEQDSIDENQEESRKYKNINEYVKHRGIPDNEPTKKESKDDSDKSSIVDTIKEEAASIIETEAALAAVTAVTGGTALPATGVASAIKLGSSAFKIGAKIFKRKAPQLGKVISGMGSAAKDLFKSKSNIGDLTSDRFSAAISRRRTSPTAPRSTSGSSIKSTFGNLYNKVKDSIGKSGTAKTLGGAAIAKELLSGGGSDNIKRISSNVDNGSNLVPHVLEGEYIPRDSEEPSSATPIGQNIAVPNRMPSTMIESDSKAIEVLWKIFSVVTESKTVLLEIGNDLKKLLKFRESKEISKDLIGANKEALIGEDGSKGVIPYAEHAQEAGAEAAKEETATKIDWKKMASLGVMGAAVVGEETASRMGKEKYSSTQTDKSGTPDKALAAKGVKFLMDKGWTKEQASGIVANLQVESGLKAHGKPGDSGKAVGIAQWHPDRQANYTKLTGKKLEESSFEEQMNFVDWELRHGSEQKAGEKIKTATTPEEAAKLTEKHFERDKTSSLGGFQQERINAAIKISKLSDKEIEDSIKSKEEKATSSKDSKGTNTATEELLSQSAIDKTLQEMSSKPIVVNEKNVNTATLVPISKSTGKLTSTTLAATPNKIPEQSDKFDTLASGIQNIAMSSMNIASGQKQQAKSPPRQQPQQKSLVGIPNVRNDEPVLLQMQFNNVYMV